MSNKETGLVTFQGYQTKYGIGDEFWIMKDDKPVELHIHKIDIAIGKDYVVCSYDLSPNTGSYQITRDDASLDKFARTKEELAARVFG